MHYWDSIILGIVQGLTEFLPVSSSAHLLILQHLLNLKGEYLSYDLILHLGTLLALGLFFFKEFLALCHLKDKNNLKFILYLGLATVVTAIIALPSNHYVKDFSSLLWLGVCLLVTAAMLLSTKNLKDSRQDLTIKKSLLIGLIQGIAVIPGISRSGSTISAARWCGVDRQKAFIFSFMLSVPVILGGGLIDIISVYSNAQELPEQFQLMNVLLGFFFSFGVGFIALKLLAKIVMGKYFYRFGYYCIVIAIISMILGLLGI